MAVVIGIRDFFEGLTRGLGIYLLERNDHLNRGTNLVQVINGAR